VRNKFKCVFHVKIVVLFDREYYYKIIGTRMVQFGGHMHFLQIKQVSALNTY
jgi:urease beta subunit